MRHGGRDDLVYGIHAVAETLKAGRRIVRSLLVVRKSPSSSGRIESILEMAAGRGIPVRWVEGGEMARKFPDREDQGIAALASPYPYSSLDEVLMGPAPRLVVALDEVQDPRNLGAVARLAAAFGAGGIITHRERSAPLSPAAVKASAGMTEHLRIASVSNLAQAVRRAKREGLWVIGLDAGATRSLYHEKMGQDMMVVLGSESRGLRRLTAELCDGLVSIPMSPICESLNVSTAAAVVLAEAARQRALAGEA
jgi:23S rRNA (guanosine2251-2'-O)-methyltransferase